MTSFGPVHKLIVREVAPNPSGHYFDIEEFPDYEIVHLDDCEKQYSEDWRCTFYTCAVGVQESNTGVAWSLGYSGCPIKEPGEYQIQAWAETIRGFDFVEYDGGLGIAEEPPA